MTMIVDPTNVSPENVVAALREFLESQPDAAAWEPFYQSSTGALIIYIAGGMGALHQYNVIVNRRESYLFYAENRSSCVAIDNTLGYSAFRGKNAKLRLDIIPNQTASVAKLDILGTYKSFDILAAEAFSMTAGLPTVVEVILGEVYTETIDIVSSDLQVFRFESAKVSDDLVLALDSTDLPLSENLKDLVDDYYVILSNAYGAVDALYLNEGAYQYGYGNTLTLSYVELVDVGYGTGDETKLILTIGSVNSVIIINNYQGPESRASLRIRGPLYHEINAVIKSRDDFKNAMLLIIPGAISTNAHDISPATVALTYVRSDLTLLTPAEKAIALAEIDNYRPFGIYMPTLSDPSQLNITLNIILTLDPNVGAVGSGTITADIATIMAQYERVLAQIVDLEKIEEDIEELVYMRIARIITTDGLIAAWNEYFIITTNISIAGTSSSSSMSSSSSSISSSSSSSSISSSSSSSSISSSSSSSSSSISSSSSSSSSSLSLSISSSSSSSSLSSISSSSIIPSSLDRGVFGGGYTIANTNIIDYITISTTGNATDFGDLTTVRHHLAATSNGISDRGVFGGGSSGAVNVIEYTTISITGNASDFGDLTEGRYYLAATSNGTDDRGVFGGGHAISESNIIDYITISTTGNATDFGDLTANKHGLAATSNGTDDRGVFGGGMYGTDINVIEYITISTTGNAADFGDLTQEKHYLASTSNGTNDRGVFGGGFTGAAVTNVIEYVTISTTGNATDFGDLTMARENVAATSNAADDRGVFGGGSGVTNIIDYITISITGDATDFGDLTVAREELAATSN